MKLSGPRCSIVIPTYDRSSLLPCAVRSALDQTISDIEIVVVDDGSTDATSEVVRRLARSDRRIRLIRQDNQGLAAARNTGLQAVRGPLVLFLDDDDLLLETALDVLLKALRPGDAASVGWAQRFNSERQISVAEVLGSEGGLLLGKHPPDPPSPGLLDLSELILRPLVPIHSALFRVKPLLTLGGFDVARSAAEDYDLWLRLVARHPVRVTGEPVALVRWHRRQMSRNLRRQSHETRMAIERFLADNPDVWPSVDSTAVRRRLSELCREESYSALWQDASRAAVFGPARAGLSWCWRDRKLWLYLFSAIEPRIYRFLHSLLLGSSRGTGEPETGD